MTISAPTHFPITAGIGETQMKVPFLDLNAHHDPFVNEFTSAIQEVIESGAFAGGPFVERFEQDFAAYCGSKYAIGVGSFSCGRRLAALVPLMEAFAGCRWRSTGSQAQ